MMSLRQMNQAQAAINKSLERLAAGKRINRGSDDPAGMIAATNLAVQRKAISTEVENNERQLKLFAAADGAQTLAQAATYTTLASLNQARQTTMSLLG